jgi:hypothetical protein
MSGKRVDRTGQRFGRLVAIEQVARKAPDERSPRWLFRCDCGSLKALKVGDLIRSRYPTKSCGCLQHENAKRFGDKSPVKHGETRSGMTPEYRAWGDMRHRCRNPTAKSFKWYGGRGIAVCERWDDFRSFLADMGRKPGPEYSIDRIDNDGNYEPGNCRWATAKQQSNNHRKSNQYLCRKATHVD